MPPILTEPGVRFDDLYNELYARGYDHLKQDAAGVARAKRMVNQSYVELTLEDKWPFRYTYLQNQGPSPLTIADLGEIVTVVDGANNFRPLSELQLHEWEMLGDAATPGTPIYYLRQAKIIHVWPLGGNLSVGYYAVPPYLVADSDTTWVPARYMDVIVDGAVRRAAKDRDNEAAANFAENERIKGLALMRRDLLPAPDRMGQREHNLDD